MVVVSNLKLLAVVGCLGAPLQGLSAPTRKVFCDYW
jgi:hypothetical protein